MTYSFDTLSLTPPPSYENTSRSYWSAIAIRASVCIAATGLTPLTLAEDPYHVLCSEQIGSSSQDDSRALAVDGAGNTYSTGFTKGTLFGPNAGGTDAFLIKYDSFSNLVWSRQIGSSADDESYAVAVDGTSSVYIAGTTTGNLAGPNAGLIDGFLIKYNTSGTLVWLRQIGTVSSDYCYGVTVDGTGNVYVTGSLAGTHVGNNDAFLIKYNSSGTQLWSQQIGSPQSDWSRGVVIDSAGNAFISGRSEGNFSGGTHAGGVDSFLAKYDVAGSLIWSRQIGTSAFDDSLSVAVDSVGNAYISGETGGSLGGPNVGSTDAFLIKYDGSGALQWSQQVGTFATDLSNSVAVDASDDVYISGRTAAGLGGTHVGGIDAFISKFDASGALLWSQQFGTVAEDRSFAVAINDSGDAYVSGRTSGNIGGPNAGSYDAFLVKLGPCYGDCDKNGGLNILDYICFGDAYANQESTADCDCSGALNILDYICFGDAYAAGCP